LDAAVEGRRRTVALFVGFALVAAIAVWPPVYFRTIPAFQQDWTWPLSRSLGLQWLHAFAGLWDERGFGHANALPWQTYVVVTQSLSVLVFGSSLGLAIWLGLALFGAAWSCACMVRAFGVSSKFGAFITGGFYATSPVVFTRLAAGHLAYLAAYALLPAIVVVARRTIEERRIAPAVLLGLAVGFAASQIQFLATAWIAVLLLAPFVARSANWLGRLALAAGIAVAVQLQALLPMALSSTAAIYQAQRALVSFEYNNSSPLADAAIMLGYFTHYYESAALPSAYWVLYALVACAFVLGLVAAWRYGLYALLLAAIGTLLTAGLYGPLSVPLAWSFEHWFAFAVFRDLHYFAAFTALGIALAIGLSIDRFKVSAPVFVALVAWCGLPVLAANELRTLLVPRAYVADTLQAMAIVRHHGDGRVLWLPAEEPVGVVGANNVGRDFSAYGPQGNSSVSDDLENNQLAYALATLRDGNADWSALESMNVRYVVVRNYVRSARAEDNFGTGFRLAYGRLDDAALGDALARDRRLTPIGRTSNSTIYELPSAMGASYEATSSDALLFSQLERGTVALAADTLPLRLAPSSVTADPRLDWVSGRFGWRYRAWLPDSIYPFAWTVAKNPISFGIPADASCVLAASAGEARLTAGSSVELFSGSWRRYALSSTAETARGTLLPMGSLAAVGERACTKRSTAAANATRLFVVPSGYDGGWRALHDGHFVPPALANDWMMAWPADDAADRRLYLPAFAQLAGFLIAVAAVGGALVIARRREARAS
jgi:hypothetical protein